MKNDTIKVSRGLESLIRKKEVISFPIPEKEEIKEVDSFPVEEKKQTFLNKIQSIKKENELKPVVPINNVEDEEEDDFIIESLSESKKKFIQEEKHEVVNMAQKLSIPSQDNKEDKGLVIGKTNDDSMVKGPSLMITVPEQSASSIKKKEKSIENNKLTYEELAEKYETLLVKYRKLDKLVSHYEELLREKDSLIQSQRKLIDEYSKKLAKSVKM